MNFKFKKLYKFSILTIAVLGILFLIIKKSDSRDYNSNFDSKSDAPHNVTCASCHLTHSSADAQLTSVAGNANLCISCHFPTGTASALPFASSDIADPSLNTGNSHAWNKSAVNATYETNIPADTEMAARIYSNNIVCSTCHNQHSQTYTPFLRMDNTGDAICKDCHSARDVGRYTDDNTNHKGSHPIGLVYDGSNTKLNASPTSPLQLVGSNIECSSCHQMHYAATNDGNLLRITNDNTLCTSCHTYGPHEGFSCNDCHQPHNPVKDNIYMVKDNINGSTVNFYAETGTNSFGDEDGTEDGICEVCHITTNYHLADGTGTSHNPGTDCMICHPHEDGFQAAGCDDCHNSTTDWDIDAHTAHISSPYNFSCSTCHLNYGSGGSLELSHPSGGDANLNFDTNGLATRNGADSNNPTWTNSTKTCGDIYCHSDGISAQGTSMGTTPLGDWELAAIVPRTSPDVSVYKTIPNWDLGTITCGDCHLGSLTPTNTATDWPQTGDHSRNAHAVNCWWCHNTDNTQNFMGTYGTSQHVDGNVLFIPEFIPDGTFLDQSPTLDGNTASSGHCGYVGKQGKRCWY